MYKYHTLDEILNNQKLTKFYYEWHKAIIDDLNRYKIILHSYIDSENKDDLKRYIDFICNNILNYQNNTKDILDNIFILIDTDNYFIYSFVVNTDDINSYVLVSKDYKNFIIARESCKCFDYEEMEFQDECYGTYDFDYFYLKDNQVYHQSYNKLMYTYEYDDLFTPANNSYLDKSCESILRIVKELPM